MTYAVDWRLELVRATVNKLHELEGLREKKKGKHLMRRTKGETTFPSKTHKTNLSILGRRVGKKQLHTLADLVSYQSSAFKARYPPRKPARRATYRHTYLTPTKSLFLLYPPNTYEAYDVHSVGRFATF